MNGSWGRLVALCAAVAWALPALAAAQASAPEALTLDGALALAAASHPGLAAARARAAAARDAARAAARAVNWPRLGLRSGWTATDTPASVFAQKLNAGLFTASDFALDRLNSPDSRSHVSSQLALELPLDAFRKAAPARRGAEAAARAAAAEARATELDVRLAVTETWHRAAVAGRAVGATARALAGATAREGEVEAQAGEGAALRADLLRARARRRRLEAELAARRGDHHSALAALARAVGADRPVEPRAGELPPPAEIGQLADWLGLVETQPAVVAARAARERAAEAARGAEISRRPELELTAALQDDRGPLSQGQATGVAGLFLRWSLFDPQRAPQRAAAVSALVAAQAELAAAVDRARFEVEAAWHAAMAARERWLAASGGTAEGQEALRVVRERRAAGLATLTDELETEAEANAAELAEITAAAEAAVARAALERAAGGRELAGGGP